MALRKKWVYKLKPGEGKNPPKFKTRIVVKGFQAEKWCGIQQGICLDGKNNVDTDGAEHSSKHGARSGAVGCQNCFSAWRLGGRNQHAVAGRICGKRERKSSMPTQEEFVWADASVPAMIPKIRMLHDRPWVPQDASRLLCLREEV